MTTTEQRYLGRTSAGLVDKVKKQAQEGLEAVRDIVTKTTEHAGGEDMEGAERGAINPLTDRSRGLGTS